MSLDLPSFELSLVTTRFAPSPTGRLHLGHAYAALAAHDLARRAGGRFLLRFEDIDHTRVRPEFYQEIEDDLKWLGIEWDSTPVRQSERLPHYQRALDTLRERGALYPCFCTRRNINQEITRIANAPHGPEGTLYPGTCRALSKLECEQRICAGDSHAWRLDARRATEITGALTFVDDRLGTHQVDPALLGDVVLARRDIATSYHLAVVVDDADQQVTHVTRGEDLLASTHAHRMLQALLDLPEPRYLHHELVCDPSGQRLATRTEALSLAVLRESGLSPAKIRTRLPLALET
ncbi:MAG: tRNA glutamyl-Q(34) synthetase GluQRS [Akkermansiaceae bacterium]